MALDGRNAVTNPTARMKIVGYTAGVVTGVSYGFNPLFGVPVLSRGIHVDTVLFYRYGFAVLILALMMLAGHRNLRLSARQAVMMVVMGTLYTCSSFFLFAAYNYIPSGIATTIVFLYPVVVAIIMMFLRVFPTWQTWVSILTTFVGVVFLCRYDPSEPIMWKGLVLAFLSGFSYAFYIVLINNSSTVKAIRSDVLTFYTLVVGLFLFAGHAAITGTSIPEESSMLCEHPVSWVNLLLLAVVPTVISTTTLAVSTRNIGATKASVMGVFEPVTAILTGILAFGEVFTVNVAVGIVLSMAAIVFMILSGRDRTSQ